MARRSGITETQPRQEGGGRPSGTPAPLARWEGNFAARYNADPSGTGRLDLLNIPNEVLAALEAATEGTGKSTNAFAKQILSDFAAEFLAQQSSATAKRHSGDREPVPCNGTKENAK